MAFYTRTSAVQYLGSSAGALLTAPSKTTRIIQRLVLHNSHTSIVNDVKLYLVASGGTAGATNILVNIGSMAVNETVVVTSLAVALYDGQSIHGIAGTASKINATFFYSERTD